MAKVVHTNVESDLVKNSVSLAKIAFVGILIGAANWFLTAAVDYYAESLALASNVSSILVAFMGWIILVRMRYVDNFIVPFAACAALWGMGAWLDGLVWWSILLASIVMYLISYILFGWLMRYKKSSIALLLVLIVVIIVRIAALI